jgi:thiol-disulfide isomerase/thioredoxin
MKQLVLGGCFLLVAAGFGSGGEDRKTVAETHEAMFKELVTKIRDVKTPKERNELLTSYGEKFVELAKKNIKDPEAVDVLVQVLSFPIPETKNGPKSKAAAMLGEPVDDLLKKNSKDGKTVDLFVRVLGLPILEATKTKVSDALKAVIKDKECDKDVRTKALTGYLGAQENILMGSKDAKAIEVARNEMAECRKVIKSDLKGQVKDLFIGATMPELKSEDLEGKEVKLSDLRGKVVVLNLWATWCPPCRAMIPHERELVKRLKDKPFVLVSISGDDKKEALTTFLKTNDMPWTHWWGGRGPLMTQLDIQYFPTIFVLDARGVIRYKNVRNDAMEEAVDVLLTEMVAQSY